MHVVQSDLDWLPGKFHPEIIYYLIHNSTQLSWNESEYSGVDSVVVQPRNLWIPDILLYNRYLSDLRQNPPDSQTHLIFS